MIIVKYNKKPWWNRVSEKEIQKTIDETIEYNVNKFEKLLKRLNRRDVE